MKAGEITYVRKNYELLNKMAGTNYKGYMTGILKFQKTVIFG